MTFSRFVFYCVLLPAAVYAGLTFYPRAYFTQSYGHDNITLHTREPLSEPADAVLARISETVAGDDFAEPGRTFEVYLGGGFGGYAFWAPFCGKSYACVHPLSGKIFVASADMEKNAAYGPGASMPRRVLESVIVHEVVKAQIKEKLGVLKYAALPSWKKDGYAEHIARETSDMNPADICSEDSADNTLIKYMEYRLVMEMIKAEGDVSYPTLMKENNSDSASLARLMRKYCNR